MGAVADNATHSGDPKSTAPFKERCARRCELSAYQIQLTRFLSVIGFFSIVYVRPGRRTP